MIEYFKADFFTTCGILAAAGIFAFVGLVVVGIYDVWVGRKGKNG